MMEDSICFYNHEHIQLKTGLFLCMSASSEAVQMAQWRMGHFKVPETQGLRYNSSGQRDHRPGFIRTTTETGPL